MTLSWSDRSLHDLESIRDFIAGNSPGNAVSFMEKIIDHVSILLSSPKAGRVVPEIGIPSIRELVFGNYRIVYTIMDDVIYILTVFERHKRADFSFFEHDV